MVPLTGALIGPAPQPPVETGAAGAGVPAGVVASGFAVAVRFLVGLVEVGTVDAGSEPSGVVGRPFVPGWETVLTVLPPSPTNDTLDLNSAVQVRASTSPVTFSPYFDWKRSTAPRVIGPKMPSSSTPTWRWTATTAAPVSPSDTRAFAGRWIADRFGTVAAATVRPPPDEATAANGAATGPAAIDALTASAAPFLRAACLRASSVISRRWTERRSERSHSSGSLRSRLNGASNGNDET